MGVAFLVPVKSDWLDTRSCNCSQSMQLMHFPSMASCIVLVYFSRHHFPSGALCAHHRLSPREYSRKGSAAGSSGPVARTTAPQGLSSSRSISPTPVDVPRGKKAAKVEPGGARRSL